jgi:hypothetical protein
MCVVWLLGLILVPFTAPFKTFDLAGSTRGHSLDGLPKDKLCSDDKAAGPPPGSLFRPGLAFVPLQLISGSNQIETFHLQHLILRI